MKLSISIPHSSLDALRKFLHPSRRSLFYLIVALTFLVHLWDVRISNPVVKALEIILLISGIILAWVGAERRSQRKWMPGLLIATFLVSTLSHWWKAELFDAIYLFVLLIVIAASLYGISDALALVGVFALLELGGHSFLPNSRAGAVQEIAARGIFLAAVALVAGYFTSSQRRRILALREELSLARSTAYAFGGAEPMNFRVAPVAAEVPDQAMQIEALEKGIADILHRIKEYFRAQSVLLYQPRTDRTLTLRTIVSDSTCISRGHDIDMQTSLLGRIFTRGVSCNWNLEAPDSLITNRDIPYYTEWQPVRHLAASPLKREKHVAGLLVVDRTSPCPFTELEITHLEAFAIQILEMIEIGKRYLEQVDQNVEYRLFYSAMSELGQSLAPAELLEALSGVCQRIVPSTHLIVALLDDSGLSYEIAFASGIENLRGTKVPSHGGTWISWMLDSGSEPLLLRDIRSHFSKMPVASPSEGRLQARSVLMIPLMAKGQKLGLLLLGSSQTDYYENWHLRILNEICQQAAANIENSLLHRRVENEAVSDGLTGLHNHRYFQERLKSECSRARRSSSRLSLLMIDIDFFKGINDTYGHRVGDAVLQQVASILKGNLRSEDAIARYGGEEFVVILTDSSREGALRMGERFRQRVERTKFLAEEHRVQVAITVGTSSFPEDAAEPWELIELADRALYAGKEAGRNRVVQYHTVSKQPLKKRKSR